EVIFRGSQIDTTRWQEFDVRKWPANRANVGGAAGFRRENLYHGRSQFPRLENLRWREGAWKNRNLFPRAPSNHVRIYGRSNNELRSGFQSFVQQLQAGDCSCADIQLITCQAN